MSQLRPLDSAEVTMVDILTIIKSGARIETKLSKHNIDWMRSWFIWLYCKELLLKNSICCGQLQRTFYKINWTLTRLVTVFQG